MTLDEAKHLHDGDYLISAHTSPPFRKLRITEVHHGKTGRYVYVRLHALAGQTAAGGWCDATAFIKPLPGWKYDLHWKDNAGNRVDVRAVWRAAFPKD